MKIEKKDAKGNITFEQEIYPISVGEDCLSCPFTDKVLSKSPHRCMLWSEALNGCLLRLWLERELKP